MDRSINVEENCRHISQHIEMVPFTDEETKFDEALAKVAVEMAMERHAGIIESMYTPMGVVYTQIGKDLTETKYYIGTGGVLVHSKNPGEILKAGNFDPADPVHLKPQKAELLLDRTYILSAMGLLAEVYPDMAVRIMKKYLIKVL